MSDSTELKVTSFTVLSTYLVITLFEACKIGISLHTSAKLCVWNTYVHFA